MTYDEWYKKRIDKLIYDYRLEKNVAKTIMANYSVTEINTIINFLQNYGNVLNVK